MSYEDYFKSLSYSQLLKEISNLESAIKRFGVKRNEEEVLEKMKLELKKRQENKIKPGGN